MPSRRQPPLASLVATRVPYSRSGVKRTAVRHARREEDDVVCCQPNRAAPVRRWPLLFSSRAAVPAGPPDANQPNDAARAERLLLVAHARLVPSPLPYSPADGPVASGHTHTHTRFAFPVRTETPPSLSSSHLAGVRKTGLGEAGLCVRRTDRRGSVHLISSGWFWSACKYGNRIRWCPFGVRRGSIVWGTESSGFSCPPTLDLCILYSY